MCSMPPSPLTPARDPRQGPPPGTPSASRRPPPWTPSVDPLHGPPPPFRWALGLAPSKDNFWSTPQPGGRYGNHTEPFNALQATIAALSTGPVQPSDAVGHSNVELILSTCTRFTGTLSALFGGRTPPPTPSQPHPLT